MPKATAKTKVKTKTASKQEPNFEAQMFKAADKLRKNMDAAEYKHIVLGLVFLKHISDSFIALHKQLTNEPDGDPEDRDEYKGKNIFYVPDKARWEYLHTRSKLPSIGQDIDEAMLAIEKENPEHLKDILPKVYARPSLDKISLGALIDLISNISAGSSSSDVLGRVYEYFLGQFALSEGQRGGQFYTPDSIVKLLVEMIEPYKGRVLDPCCGSGGMFVMSEKFVQAHQGKIDDISLYGQESNRTTWRLARMNLAMRAIDGEYVKWNNEGSFLKNEHSDVKVDFVLANPPFNDSDWGGDRLRSDARWRFGVPPVGNANFAWVQHFIYHLAPKGVAGFVLAKGSLTSKTSTEGEIRKNIVEKGWLDCIVNLPPKLFLNTQIPACLWFVSNKRAGGAAGSSSRVVKGGRAKAKSTDNAKGLGHGPGQGKVLFIEAQALGRLINRRNRVFDDKDIKQVADTYHAWRTGSKKYKNVAGFCAQVDIEKIRAQDFVLSPGRYVGTAPSDDNIDFTQRFHELRGEFEQQLKQEAVLNKRILENLKRVDVKEWE